MLVGYLFGTADRKVFNRKGTRTIPQPWQKDIDKTVLGYANQQVYNLSQCVSDVAPDRPLIKVIYSISILIAGFIRWEKISAYHYNLLIYLAWMSSNTHLSTVTLLPWIFDDAKRNFVRMLRLAAMSIVAIMLVGALVPTTKDSGS